MFRADHNLGSHLRLTKSSFLSLAQCFQKHRSSADKDFCHKQSPGSGNSSTPSRPSKRPRVNQKFPYKVGVCFDFQREKGCQVGARCRFAHECNNCGSGDHGAIYILTKVKKKRKFGFRRGQEESWLCIIMITVWFSYFIFPFFGLLNC